MAAAKRSGKHLLLPELQAWYDTLKPVVWNDFPSAQAIRDFAEPDDASSYGPMPSDLAEVKIVKRSQQRLRSRNGVHITPCDSCTE